MISRSPFIVGVGRSGTTLLRLMLDAHPEMAIPSETHFLSAILDNPPSNRQDFVAVLLSSHTWRDFHVDADKLLKKLDSQGDFELAEAIRIFYINYAERFDKPRWGDKTPPYVKYLKPLSELLPEACFIHMIRDGRDVALSYRDKWFGPAGSGIAGSASFWKETILHARHQAEQLPRDRYLEIHFEELISEPEKTLRKICQYIDLPWHQEILNYHLSALKRLSEIGDRPDENGNILVPRQKRLSIHQNTQFPPDPAHSGKWVHAFTPEQIAGFNSVAGDLLKDLGYDL